MRYISELTSVEAVVRQLVQSTPGSTPSTELSQFENMYDYLADVISEVSDYIATECGMTFVPYREDKTMYFQDIRDDRLYDRVTRLLWLPDTVMSLLSVTWDDTLLAVTDYRLYPTDEYAGWGLKFGNDASIAWNGEDNTGVEISAWWGWHLNGSAAYSTVETVTLANDTVTTIDVADATVYEIYGFYRCENELMKVIAKTVNANPTPDTVTVLRGQNGTTAAAHSAKALQRYNVVPGVRHVATRMSAYLYQKRLDVGGTVQIGDAAFLLDQLPVTVKTMIAMRRRWSFGHI